MYSDTDHVGTRPALTYGSASANAVTSSRVVASALKRKIAPVEIDREDDVVAHQVRLSSRSRLWGCNLRRALKCA
jgi:hypothetical protein